MLPNVRWPVSTSGAVTVCNLIHKIAKRIGCRQIVTATAVTYFRRFYVKNAISETDPCLVAAACMYVATKVEESPSHIKTVLEAAKFVFSGPFPSEATVLAEMEFYLIEDLDFHLMVWQPYRDLAQFTGRENSALPIEAVEKMAEWMPPPGSAAYQEFQREIDRQASMLDLSVEALQMAWFIINDTYRTDLILLYPPYIIALAAIYVTVVLQPHPSLRAIKALPPPTMMHRSSTEQLGPHSRTRQTSHAHGGSQLSNLAASHSVENSATSSPSGPSSTTSKVVPLDFFARFPISMALVLEVVQEIVASYELWNRLEHPSLSIHRPPQNPTEIDTGLSAARLNRPFRSANLVSSISKATPQSSPMDLPLAVQAEDKLADEKVVELLVRMRKAREHDLQSFSP
ncbi:cyclin-like protein [Phakopsora pachyrhizi]|nr:cyclin-like protein [Phakopsora pachyrhizi]